MPNIGDEIRGEELGKESSSAKQLIYVWVKCPHCLEERWTQKKSELNPANNRTRLCLLCVRNNARTFSIHTHEVIKEG